MSTISSVSPGVTPYQAPIFKGQNGGGKEAIGNDGDADDAGKSIRAGVASNPPSSANLVQGSGGTTVNRLG